MIKLTQPPQIDISVKTGMPETLPIEKSTLTVVVSYESEDTPLLMAFLRHLDPEGEYINTIQSKVEYKG